MEKDLDSGRLFFDPSANRASMLFLGNNNNVIFPAGQRAMMTMEENVTKKRPFFTSPDELFYDEEYYYDEQLPEKKRRLTPDQVVSLEKSFEEENKLEPERKSELAKKLGLQPRQVAVWFQNRRARSKTKQLERDYDVLKSSYDSLRSNYDSILNENALLKTQVHSLSEKLETKEVEVEVEVNNMMGPKSDPVVQAVQLDDNGPNMETQEKLINKVEDRQSSGSGGSSSAVENEENFPMVMDSTCDSYFECHPTSPYMVAAVAGHSEEDDISDDGPICFSNYFAVDHHDVHHLQHEEEDVGPELGWWVWS